MPGQSDDHPATSALYDLRYADNYMDTDAYSLWGHGDLRTRQVVETLCAVGVRPESVLDYGCGVGAWLGVLSHVFPEAKLHGVDISGVAINKARTKYPDCRLEVFGGSLVPFADGQFDLVFTYHVLEHVDDVEASIRDIARIIRPRGYAVVIFPCGNPGSFLDRTMNLLCDSRLPASDGRTVLFFEEADGHVRRMTSSDTVEIFRRNGLDTTAQFFSGHFFGTVDWLCRGTGPAYINRVFSGKPAIGQFAGFRLELTRRLFIGIHRLIQKKALDLNRKRHPFKQAAAFVVKQLATTLDSLLDALTSLEWRLRKHDRRGTAQYLVFRKP